MIKIGSAPKRVRSALCIAAAAALAAGPALAMEPSALGESTEVGDHERAVIHRADFTTASAHRGEPGPGAAVGAQPQLIGTRDGSLAQTGPSKLAEFGRALFCDPHLSVDATVSCATCHDAARVFSDAKAVSHGVSGRMGTRNTPSLLDVTRRTSFSWDGRHADLPSQVLAPLVNAREMGNASVDDVLSRIHDDPTYRRLVEDNGGVFDASSMAAALIAYLSTLQAGTTPYDRYVAGDADALSPAARRGLALFEGRAGCSTCHVAKDPERSFTDGQFHRTGLGVDKLLSQRDRVVSRAMGLSPAELDAVIARDADVAALGRFLVTGNPLDIAAYRTPSLRNVAATPPYMHDGSVATLEEAVDIELYYRQLSPARTSVLTPSERQEIVTFLRALTASTTDAFGCDRAQAVASPPGTRP